MPRERLEVADIFRAQGPAWRKARAGHLGLDQLKVMSAIENCRTAALGGHVAACQDCGHSHIAYNSCRNRHCPKCQGAAARDWLEARWHGEQLACPGEVGGTIAVGEQAVMADAMEAFGQDVALSA